MPLPWPKGRSTATSTEFWLIDLTLVSDPDLVPAAVAAALSFEIGCEDPIGDLISLLHDKRMLLVLDNCEHVIGSAAALIDEVMKRAPGVHILATSREPLLVEGELVYRLPPLASPPPSVSHSAGEALTFPAVQLFVDRVVANSGKFELSDTDAPSVAEICRRMDGLPLAIGFAAARVAVFGVREFLADLDANLRPLTGGRRGAPPRQRSMSATLDWSYRLLDDVEQFVLRRLAIFADEFTLSAASKVAADAQHPEGEIADKVMELVAKSLVAVNLSDGKPRFRLFETTRAYTQSKAAESHERNTIQHHKSPHAGRAIASALG